MYNRTLFVTGATNLEIGFSFGENPKLEIALSNKNRVEIRFTVKEWCDFLSELPSLVENPCNPCYLEGGVNIHPARVGDSLAFKIERDGLAILVYASTLKRLID